MVKRWPQPTDKPSLSVEVQYSPLIVTAQTIGQPNVGPGGDLQVSFLFKMTQWKNWTMLPKGCGKIYDTIIRSQRQIKRFGTWNPVGDLGFRFCCCCEQGSVIRAIRQKALATAAAAGLEGWRMGGGCLRSWEGGKNFRWKAREQAGEKRPWTAYPYSLLSNPGRLQKSRGEKNQTESDVKWKSWVMLTLIFKPDGGLGSVNGPSLEANENKSYCQ